MPDYGQSNRAVTYARTSSAGQSGELSHGGQFYDIEKYLQDNGLVEVRRFEEVGSGLSASSRKTFQQMFSFALDPENDIAHVVFSDLSRYSRGQSDPRLYLELLESNDMILHSVIEGNSEDADELHWDIKFSLNHGQSRDISRLTLRGQRDAIRAGYAISSKIPFGYQRDYVTVGDKRHPIYVPHPVNAVHVTMMFDMKDQGRTTHEIYQYLLDNDVPSPTGLPRWPKETIRNVLTNRVYLGELEYFKSSRSRFPKNRKKYQQMTCPNAHQALVTEDVFNRVQKRIKDNTRPKAASPRSEGSPNPLSELVKCVACGSDPEQPPNMVVITNRSGKCLTCSAKKNSGIAHCQSENIPLEPFLDLIVSSLMERALTQEVLQEQIQSINANSAQLVDEERTRQSAITKRIAETNREKTYLKQRIREYEETHPKAVRDLMDDLEAVIGREEDLKSQRSHLDDEMAETIAFATDPEAIVEAAMDMKTYLAADDRSVAREFLRGFIKRVDIAHGVATVNLRLPVPNIGETGSDYVMTVPLQDTGILLEKRSPGDVSVMLDEPGIVPNTERRRDYATGQRGGGTQVVQGWVTPGSDRIPVGQPVGISQGHRAEGTVRT